MKQKSKFFLKNISYTFVANIISLAISSLAILIIPKKVGIQDYGYFQLYLFYTSYVGFFHFGWSDGIYLRYGGKQYQELNPAIIRMQFWLMLILTLGISTILWRFFPTFVVEYEKLNILKLTIICALIIIPRSLIWLLLQSIGEILNFAKFTIVEKSVYIIAVLVLLPLKNVNYYILILADLLGKGVALIYTIVKYPELFIGKMCTLHIGLKESAMNINVGSKLMLANIASVLVIGIVRFGIEGYWGIDTFGKISLSISICNLLLVFINSIGIVVFPMLKRVSNIQLVKVYDLMNNLLSIILFFALALYFPLKYILSLWLPQYAESLYYMIFLFPICIFESKMALIFNTYLKILRKEKTIMLINTFVVIISGIVTLTNVYLIKNLPIMVLSILFLLILRYILGQISVGNLLKVSYWKRISADLCFCGIFIVISYLNRNELQAFILYACIYLIYLYCSRKRICMYIAQIQEGNL